MLSTIELNFSLRSPPRRPKEGLHPFNTETAFGFFRDSTIAIIYTTLIPPKWASDSFIFRLFGYTHTPKYYRKLLTMNWIKSTEAQPTNRQQVIICLGKNSFFIAVYHPDGYFMSTDASNRPRDYKSSPELYWSELLPPQEFV